MTTVTVEKVPEHKDLVVGSVGLVIAGILTTFLAPLVTALFADDFKFGAGQAGILVAAGLAGVAVAAFAIAPVIGRLSRKKIGLIGAGTATIGLVATGFWATSFPEVLVAQIVTGLGAGLSYSAANSALSFARFPEKAFSTTTIAYMLVGAGMLTLGPLLHELYPLRGIYLGMALAEALCMLLILRLPDVRNLPQAHEPPPELPPTAVTEGKPRLRRFMTPGAVLVVAFLILNAGNMAIWSFAQNIGEASGLSNEATSTFLGISQLVGLLGAGVTMVLGGKVGKMTILAPAVAMLAIGNLAIGISWIPLVFMIGFVVVNIAFFCLSPLVLALAAELDPHTPAKLRRGAPWHAKIW